MHNNKKKINKVLFGVIGVISACLVLVGTYLVLYNINSKPDVASTTSKNCEIIHNIFTQEDENQRNFTSKYLMDWKDYRDQTLYNLGLCHRTYNKEWNGTWLIDEEFIRTYVTKYSADEFMQIYDIYVNGFTTAGIKRVDEDFYENNPALPGHISETTLLLFEMSDLFEVANYHPTEDKVLNTTSETRAITGSFNTGSDNHIESMKGKRTTDTYEYDGYKVTHIYGDKYDGGQYGWVNGEFIDIPAHFDSMNEYYLYVDDRCIMGPVKKMKDLSCRWVVIGDVKYYERILNGGRITYGSGQSYYFRFSQPVSILTASSQDSVEKYIEYES